MVKTKAKPKAKPKAKKTQYGIGGESGIITDEAGGLVMHINAPYGNRDEDTVFVATDEGMSWTRMKKDIAAKKKLSPIKCSYCVKPAVRLDHSWPYLTGTTSCADHLDRLDAD
jgi:hypothetical protein